MRVALRVGFKWTKLLESLTQPYSLSIRTIISLIALILLVPLYIFIGEHALLGRSLHRPELPLDLNIPLQPAWTLVYAVLYLFLILLPMFLLRQDEQIRRTAFAYLFVWLTAYFCFLTYPTVAPRPVAVIGEGFALWGLQFLYSADPPSNCFPSLHVAHSFVSALTCYRVHRGMGIAASACAAVIGVSTLYTKQHYILDVLAGVVLGSVAYFLFLHDYPRERIPELDRKLAPMLALSAIVIVGLVFLCYWVAYKMGITL